MGEAGGVEFQVGTGHAIGDPGAALPAAGALHAAKIAQQHGIENPAGQHLGDLPGEGRPSTQNPFYLSLIGYIP